MICSDEMSVEASSIFLGLGNDTVAKMSESKYRTLG